MHKCSTVLLFHSRVLSSSVNAGINFDNDSSRDFELSENEFVDHWAKVAMERRGGKLDGIHRRGYGDAWSCGSGEEDKVNIGISGTSLGPTYIYRR